MSERNWMSMSPGDMYLAMGANARNYAEAFCERHPEADIEEMFVWFANAMCAEADFGNTSRATFMPDGSGFVAM